MTLAKLTNEDICAVIGYRLKAERLRLRLTQDGVARSAHVSLRTYKRFENGVCGSVRTLVAVLRAMDRLRLLEVVLPAATLSPRDTLQGRVERIRKRVCVGRL